MGWEVLRRERRQERQIEDEGGGRGRGSGRRVSGELWSSREKLRPT